MRLLLPPKTLKNPINCFLVHGQKYFAQQKVKDLYVHMFRHSMRLDLNLNKNPFWNSMALRELQGAHFIFGLNLNPKISN